MTANLDSLKSSFADNLNIVVQKLQSSNENFDAKINTLNQHVHDLKIEMGALKKIMENQEKQKTLEVALLCLDLNSFTYFECSNNYHANKKNSSELAKTVIRLFMLSGYGYNLPSEATLTNDHLYSSKSTAEKELLIKAFVDKFAGQIEALIKREPRLVKNENGAYSIFMSEERREYVFIYWRFEHS